MADYKEIKANDEELLAPEEGVSIKHSKDGCSIYITIYNTNNLANEGGNAGLKQKAETGGQNSGIDGQNANQGGQIAEKCGQNANQDGEVKSVGCGQKIDTCCDDCDDKHEPKHDCMQHDLEKPKKYKNKPHKDENKKNVEKHEKKHEEKYADEYEADGYEYEEEYDGEYEVDDDRYSKVNKYYFRFCPQCGWFEE